jgi:hypothetical protein
VVAHPIGDGLQPHEQGHRKVHQVPHHLNLVQNVTLQKILYYRFQGLVILHLFTKFNQNCSSGLGFV